MQHKGVYILYRTFAYLDVLFCKVLDVVYRFRMVYRLQVFTHGFSRNGHALVYHKLRFLKRERVPLDTVALIGVFYGQSVLNLFQSLNRQGTHCRKTGFQRVAFL